MHFTSSLCNPRKAKPRAVHWVSLCLFSRYWGQLLQMLVTLASWSILWAYSVLLTQNLPWSQHPPGSLMVWRYRTGLQDLCLPRSHVRETAPPASPSGSHSAHVGHRAAWGDISLKEPMESRASWGPRTVMRGPRPPGRETADPLHTDSASQGIALEPQAGRNTRLQRSALDPLHQGPSAQW